MNSDSDTEPAAFPSQGEWTENKDEPKTVLSKQENMDKLGLMKIDIR